MVLGDGQGGQGEGNPFLERGTMYLTAGLQLGGTNLYGSLACAGTGALD